MTHRPEQQVLTALAEPPAARGNGQACAALLLISAVGARPGGNATVTNLTALHEAGHQVSR